MDDAGPGGPRFGVIVHHTDAEREYAYDRQTEFGRLDKALDAAAVNRLDRRRHEERLEEDLRVRQVSQRDNKWFGPSAVTRPACRCC